MPFSRLSISTSCCANEPRHLFLKHAKEPFWGQFLGKMTNPQSWHTWKNLNRGFCEIKNLIEQITFLEIFLFTKPSLFY